MRTIQSILSPNACPKLSVGTLAAGLALFAAASASANTGLIPNGSFTLGNGGFTSTATFVANGTLTNGQYSIRTAANTANGQWCQSDHTSGAGNFLVCDGASGTSTVAWKTTISVCQGASYTFSAWVANLICPPKDFTDPSIVLRVDGAIVAGPVVLPENPDVWSQLSANFTATGGSVLLEIVSTSTAAVGNDFGIDDVCLQQTGSGLVTNGDFSAGNTAFTSAATFVAAGILGSGQYSIRTSAVTANGQWCQTDHTSGGGNFLVCDGFSSTTTAAWKQTVTVVAGKKYSFSAWVDNLICTNKSFSLPVIELRVNGTKVAGPLTLAETPNNWKKITGIFTAGGASALLEIVSTTTASVGNDFGIDDVRLDCQPQYCSPDFGFASGALLLSVWGDPVDASGSVATFAVSGATPGGIAVVIVGFSAQPTTVPGIGTLLPFPVALTVSLPVNAAGQVNIPVPGGINNVTDLYVQVAAPAGSGIQLSNAVAMTIGT